MEASIRQGKQVLDMLSGHSSEQVQQLIGAGDLLKLMMQADLSGVDRQAFAELMHPTRSPLFCTPQEVYDAFLARSDARNWDIDLVAKNRLWKKIQSLGNFKSRLSHNLSLNIWLGSEEATVSELWAWICDVLPNWKWGYLEFDENHLWLNAGVAETGRYYGKKPFVRAVEISLNANLSKPVHDVCAADLTGFEVMTTFAVHPNYLLRKVDYDTISNVWLLGALRTLVFDSVPQRGVPYLRWDLTSRRLMFSVVGENEHRRFTLHALPTAREL